MNTKFKTLAASIMLAGALGASNQASATLYVVDDFSANQGPVVDNTITGPVVSVLSGVRTITVDQTASVAPGSLDSQARVVAGSLFASNDSGTNSIIDLAYTLAANTLPSASTAASFFLDVKASDGNQTNVEFFFNSVSLASFSIPANTINDQLNFNLTTAQIATVSAGGLLGVRMTGATGWDSQYDTFGFNDTPPGTKVPEANTLALMGIGLAGFAAARRKKQA